MAFSPDFKTDLDVDDDHSQIHAGAYDPEQQLSAAYLSAEFFTADSSSPHNEN